MFDHVATTIAYQRVADLHREAEQARLARVARAAWRRRRTAARHYSPPTPSPRSVLT
jgi:predicted nucleic acid-binding Zn ribbon protein